MQLSWGGKGGVPLETIYGVTKGIKTDVSFDARVGRGVGNPDALVGLFRPALQCKGSTHANFFDGTDDGTQHCTAKAS